MWIKLCGMTDDAAVEAALAAGADALGFVIAPSVRRVSPERAAQLAKPARGRAVCVAVTLHPSPALVEEIFATVAPDLLQIDLLDLSVVPSSYRGRVLPVVRETTAVSGMSRLLYEGAQSGVGRTADWSCAEDLARRYEVVLAGGLTPDNVASAIHRVRPFGVDVSSGIEASAGRKCPDKIAAFVRSAREASRTACTAESTTEESSS